jgi:hypothetical protein
MAEVAKSDAATYVHSRGLPEVDAGLMLLDMRTSP